MRESPVSECEAVPDYAVRMCLHMEMSCEFVFFPFLCAQGSVCSWVSPRSSPSRLCVTFMDPVFQDVCQTAKAMLHDAGNDRERAKSILTAATADMMEHVGITQSSPEIVSLIQDIKKGCGVSRIRIDCIMKNAAAQLSTCPRKRKAHSLSDTQLDSQATDSQGNGCEVSATQPATDSQIYEMYGDGHPDDTPATSTSKSDVFALAETIYQHLCSGSVADVFSGLEALANHGVVIEEATLDALQLWECQCRMKDADVTQHTFTHARGDGTHCPSPCQRACSDVPMISQSDKNAIQSSVAMRVEDQHSQGFLVTNPAGHGPTQGGDVTKRNRFASFAEIQVAAVWSSHQRDQAQRAVQEFQGAVSKAFQGQADRSVKFAARVLVDGPFEVATRLRSFLGKQAAPVEVEYLAPPGTWKVPDCSFYVTTHGNENVIVFHLHMPLKGGTKKKNLASIQVRKVKGLACKYRTSVQGRKRVFADYATNWVMTLGPLDFEPAEQTASCIDHFI